MRNWMLFGVLFLFACDSADSNDNGGVGESSGGGITFEVSADELDFPSDSMPSSDGTVIWYVLSGTDEPGLYRVPPDGDPALVAAFNDAVSLVLSTDDASVYVGTQSGVFSVDASTGEATQLKGTENCSVTHVDLHTDLVFAAECDGQAGVFTIPTTGGSITLEVATDTIPSGVFPFDDGTFAVAEGRSVHRRGGPSDSVLVADATLGTPTGMSLTPDKSTLMVSSLSGAGTAQVLLVNLETGDTSIYDEPIKQNKGAGGLHRSWGPQVYAWADYTGGSLGKVYKITMQ